MKKLLRLGDMARGGRERGEVYDLLGIRAVVQPRADLPPDTAEQAAVQVSDCCDPVWGPNARSRL